MKLQKVLILLLALCLLRWDIGVASSEPAQPSSDDIVSFSSFLGNWEAVEGKTYTKWGEFLPLNASKSALKIISSGGDSVTIDLYVYYENARKNAWQGRRGTHKVEISALQGALPKTIRWKETKEMTVNGRKTADVLYRYTIEFKTLGTASIRVFDGYSDSTATFKL
ncbi:MAG: hypothetical protein LBG29_02855 [Synergistaceae bacterium]|jgi:hypothetical protein|nr:hypothetical protein [Synergistaceae bacterium]